MKTKGFWVIKTSAGGYWCSGGFDPQIRKAHVYTWKEKAEEAIETFIRRKYFPAEITYEVVAVAEPKELKDTEAESRQSSPTPMRMKATTMMTILRNMIPKNTKSLW